MRDWEPFKECFLAYATGKGHSDILTGKMEMQKAKYNPDTGDRLQFSDDKKKSFVWGTKAHNDLLLSMNQAKVSTGNDAFAVVNSFKNCKD